MLFQQMSKLIYIYVSLSLFYNIIIAFIINAFYIASVKFASVIMSNIIQFELFLIISISRHCSYSNISLI